MFVSGPVMSWLMIEFPDPIPNPCPVTETRGAGAGLYGALTSSCGHVAKLSTILGISARFSPMRNELTRFEPNRYVLPSIRE